MKSAVFLLSILLVIALAQSQEYSPEILRVPNGISGTGTTTRYWDCCKPSCSWPGNVKKGTQPVATCAKDGVTRVDKDAKSGCDDGPAYMCNNQQPFYVNSTLAYGFGAASFSGGVDVNLCCACFLFTFTDQITNKKLLVQVTNTGSDLGQNHFDIALPGGGVGIFQKGCHDQWNAPWNGWGDQYGGVHSRDECLSQLPKQLQPGCLFRFDFLQNADNPKMRFEQVTCPAEIVQRSGCSA